MSESDDTADSRPKATAEAEGDVTRPPERLERGVQPGHWVTRLVVALVLVVIAFIAYQASESFFPRWWAQRIGNQVDGRFWAGTTWGLFYGFVFTFVPVLLLLQIRRRFFSWLWRGVVAVVAIVLAAPNWLTLFIVVSSSNSAHAGERILDVDAPNFRGATLAGAVLGALLALALTGTSMWMKHRKKQLDRTRSERDELRASQQSRADRRRDDESSG